MIIHQWPKNNKFFLQMIYLRHSFAIIVLLLFPAIAQDSLSIYEEAVNQRKVLASKVDSLELEIQSRKRAGVSIELYEEELRSYKDSISRLRSMIENTFEFYEKSESHEKDFKLFFQNLLNSIKIEWFLGIISLSGLLLFIIYFFKNLFNSKKSMQKAGKDPQKVRQKDMVTKTNIPGKTNDFATVDKTIHEEEEIEIIRKRITGTTPAIPVVASYETTIYPKTQSTDNTYETPKIRFSFADEVPARSLKERIITDVQQGLDIHEISKRYQVSADQVRLILRMSVKK